MGTIYCIKNKVNGKRYVGSTINLTKRWRSHRSSLNKGVHGNSHLQSAWNKYGSDAFEFSVLEDNIAEDILIDREMYYMSSLKTLDSRFGYNEREELGGGFIRVSDDTKKRISESKSGEKSIWFGKELPEETRRRISEANKGHAVSLETRLKLSEINKGKTMSDETRRNMSIAQTGRIQSEETKRKISDANKGKPSPLRGRTMSEEVKDKISKSNKAVQSTPEARQKMMNLKSKDRYIVTSPSGRQYAVKSAKAFSEEFGLWRTNLINTAKGVSLYSKGYSARYMSQEEIDYYEPHFNGRAWFEL